MKKGNFGKPIAAPEELYAASQLLSKSNKKKLGMTVQATIYVQDPLVAKRDRSLGLKPIELDWEPGLTHGPTSPRLAVVDYDADKGVLNAPARWDARMNCFVDPLDERVGPKHAKSPQFHQVNVWAIVQNILNFYEDPQVMGRAIPWGFEGNRLIIAPHAGYAQNAFYDRRSKSLQFYYCGSAKDPVFTCLSHDIVAHETGHAILDGIRPYYNERSSLQTAAFHEFIADLTAILSTLRNRHVRQVVADDSGGDLSKEDVIGPLAERFGEVVSAEVHGSAARPYLRTAHKRVTMKDIEGEWRPHECSLVMTSAMFKILTEMTLKLKKQEESSQKKPKAAARRALWRATDHFTRIALRALDLCPPVDIQFIDYVRAVLQADKLAYPKDTNEYREIIRSVFHERGFCNRSEDEHMRGLCDLDPEVKPYKIQFHRYDIERLSRSRTAAYHFLNMNRNLLKIPLNQDIIVVDLYDTDKDAEAGRSLPREIVLEYIWREDVSLQGKRFGHLEGQTVQLLCGGTLVFDGRGNVLYLVRKPGFEGMAERRDGKRRRAQLINYLAQSVGEGIVTLTDVQEEEGFDTATSRVVGRRVEGVLKLESTPHLRHDTSEED